MKLNTRLGLILVPLILLPLLVAGGLTFSQYQAQYQHQTEQRMHAFSTEKQRLLFKELESARANLLLLEQATALRQYLWADDYSRSQILYPSLLRTFKGYLHAFPLYEQIGLYPVTGAPAVASQRPLAPPWPSMEDFVRRLKHSRENQLNLLHGPDDTLRLVVGKPIWLNRSPTGLGQNRIEHLGYLTIQLSARALEDMVNEGTPGKGGLTLITDVTGRILYHSPQDANRPPLPMTLPNPLLPGENMATLRLADIQYHAITRQLLPELYLTVLLPSNEFYKAVFGIALRIGGYSLLLVAILLLVIYAAMDRLLLNPIRRLHLATQALTDGNTDFRASGRRDELGELESGFEHMSRQLRQSTETLHRMAYQDRLTGLANRSSLQQRLQQLMGQPHPFALVFMDLDGFKKVNDSYGHEQGDQLLISLAQRLEHFSRQLTAPPGIDTIVRLGGDEFTLLLTGPFAENAIANLLSHLTDAIRAPFEFNCRQFTLSASFGIACYPDDGRHASELLKNADMAMYQAKAAGKSGHVFYEHHAAAVMRFRARLGEDLPEAIRSGHFELYLQPIVSTAGQLLAGFESLLRWQHPELGQVMPADFIPVAEETGLISELGAWTIEQSCALHNRWQRPDRQLLLTVNVSGQQLINNRLLNTLRHCVEQCRMPPGSLYLELTETTLMHIDDSIKQVLEQIRRLGIKLAVDDFGTGHSSLHLLQTFPISMLKIDGSFIAGLERCHTSETIIKTVLAMARELDYLVVAEGVETALQAQRLIQLKCDYLQGFHYGKPVPLPAFEQQWITDRASISTP